MAKSKIQKSNSENKQSENQESNLNDVILCGILGLMLRRSRLHKRLMNIILCLESLEIGIDADNKPSAKIALEQHRLFSQGIDEAISYTVCELPQTDFTQELYTVLYMIKQNFENTRKFADYAIDVGNEENIIGHIREAFKHSKEETLSHLKHLSAQIITKESLRELREMNKNLENECNLLEMSNDLTEYENQVEAKQIDYKNNNKMFIKQENNENEKIEKTKRNTTFLTVSNERRIELIDDFCYETNKLINYINNPDENCDISTTKINMYGEKVNELVKKIWPQINFDEIDFPFHSPDDLGVITRYSDGIFSVPREKKEQIVEQLQQWIERALQTKIETQKNNEIQKSEPKESISIQNFNGVLGNFQAENVQTHQISNVHNYNDKTRNNKKGIFIIIGSIVTFLAALLTCLYYLDWLEPLKSFFLKLFLNE